MLDAANVVILRNMTDEAKEVVEKLDGVIDKVVQDRKEIALETRSFLGNLAFNFRVSAYKRTARD